MSLFGDNSPSPERDPSDSNARLKRPHLLVQELTPISLQIPLDNIDRLIDVLRLSGLTPNEESIQYLWKTIRTNRLLNLDTFTEHLGALGLGLELAIATKHELEWRDGDYRDKTSVILTTKHREGSEVGILSNLSEGHPALDGLHLEVFGTPEQDTIAMANIFWDREALSHYSAGEMWDLLRGFYSYFKGQEIPEALPLAPGQQEKFYYLTVELDPMLVKVARLATGQNNQEEKRPLSSSIVAAEPSIKLKLRNPPLGLLTTLCTMTGALQLESPWMEPSSRMNILKHLANCLSAPTKLDVDILKMCEQASPCLIFWREETCNGETFPPTKSSIVRMGDSTCPAGEFVMELRSHESDPGMLVSCQWHAGTARFREFDWKSIYNLAAPYTVA